MTSSDNPFEQRGDTLLVELWYPRTEKRPKYVEINLIDVRASDGIRISYDFERDGWKIEQPTISSWTIDDKVCDEGWTEVAFVQSWQLETKNKE